MEKLIAAAAIAWNPIGEVRQRLLSAKLTISAVLGPAIAAIIACTLFRMTAFNFFWNTFRQATGSQAPEFTTDKFVVELASSVGALVPVAVLRLLPAKIFDPFGYSASAAAILVVTAGNSFYHAVLAALGYFIAGAQAWANPQHGFRTYQVLEILIAYAVTALTIFFWCRIGVSILQLRLAAFIGISATGIAVVLAAIILVVSLSS